MNREKTFKSVYGVEAPKEVLELFVEDLKQVKRKSKSKQYQGLLELLLKYSYAIFYDYKTVSIINNRLKYRQEAMKILNSEDVEEAFSFIARATEPKQPKAPKKDLNDSSNTCIAKDEINRLKERLVKLDADKIKLAKGQDKQDERIFIKIALVALSTGERLKEITETLELSSKKGIVYFTNDDNKEEGVILELDIKTARGYLKDIKNHYRERIARDIDISTGIRKAIKRLNIKISHTTIKAIIEYNRKKPKSPKNENITTCGNINHLNQLYKHCLTSSAQ